MFLPGSGSVTETVKAGAVTALGVRKSPKVIRSEGIEKGKELGEITWQSLAWHSWSDMLCGRHTLFWDLSQSPDSVSLTLCLWGENSFKEGIHYGLRKTDWRLQGLSPEGSTESNKKTFNKIEAGWETGHFMQSGSLTKARWCCSNCPISPTVTRPENWKGFCIIV